MLASVVAFVALVVLCVIGNAHGSPMYQFNQHTYRYVNGLSSRGNEFLTFLLCTIIHENCRFICVYMTMMYVSIFILFEMSFQQDMIQIWIESY